MEVGSPTTCFQQAISDLQGGHAEIRDPDVVLLIQQQILRLQVSVAEKVQVRQAAIEQ